MYKIPSETRKAFVSNLHSESEFSIDQIKVVVLILNEQEDSFIKLFFEITSHIDNMFIMLYIPEEGKDEDYMRKIFYNYDAVNRMEVQNYPIISTICEDSGLLFNDLYQGIVDFIFYADLTRKIKFPQIGKIEITKPNNPKEFFPSKNGGKRLR